MPAVYSIYWLVNIPDVHHCQTHMVFVSSAATSAAVQPAFARLLTCRHTRSTSLNIDIVSTDKPCAGVGLQPLLHTVTCSGASCIGLGGLCMGSMLLRQEMSVSALHSVRQTLWDRLQHCYGLTHSKRLYRTARILPPEISRVAPSHTC